jgi:hypothetical protein
LRPDFLTRMGRRTSGGSIVQAQGFPVELCTFVVEACGRIGGERPLSTRLPDRP